MNLESLKKDYFRYIFSEGVVLKKSPRRNITFIANMRLERGVFIVYTKDPNQFV